MASSFKTATATFLFRYLEMSALPCCQVNALNSVRELQAGVAVSVRQGGVSGVEGPSQLPLFTGGTAGTHLNWFFPFSLLPRSGAEPRNLSSLPVTPFL